MYSKRLQCLFFPFFSVVFCVILLGVRFLLFPLDIEVPNYSGVSSGR